MSEAYKSFITVNYPTHKNIYTQSDKIKKPNIILSLEPNTYYTLIMFDPDVPDKYQPGWLHMLFVNITKDNINKKTSEAIVPYAPPTPVGIHHYHFILYKQLNYINITVKYKRPNFNLNSFINKYKLRNEDTVIIKVSNNM